jgi:transglutaminase-like putative cysteine protease
MAILARLVPEAHLPRFLPALTGGWQQREGDTLRLAPSAGTDSTPEAAAMAEPLLDGEDSALAQVAALATVRERLPEGKALALGDWVRRTITLREGSGAASAARVFQSRQGTAAERIRLLVALCRSAGLTARPVSGVVLSGGRWLPREWAEVWTGTWTPIDPELTRTAPRAGRVRLLTGGSSRLLDLALRAGRLRLDLLEETR